MTATRKSVEFAKRIGLDRVGNDYVYGGNWNPFDTNVGTDCSGCVIDICDAVRNGTAMAWTRHGMSTETWRPIEVGETGTIFNTVCVANPRDFPADAAVKIAIHHGPGGGANSHMWCDVDGVRLESNGDDGCVTGADARDVYDTSYANDWHYLPGGIVEDGTAPTAPTPTPAKVRIFGPDISNNNGFVDIAQIQREGFDFVFAKVSEGSTFKDTYWARTRDECQRLGLIVAGYHYVKTDDPNRQADNFVSTLGDRSIPAMLDFEANSGGIGNYWAVKNAIEARGVTVRLSYIPRWYWQQIGQPDLSSVPGLIQSSYVNGTGYASVLYPGDTSSMWNGFGGRNVDILQFTDKALIAGMSLDANAFRGTPDQLRELLGLQSPGGISMADAQELQNDRAGVAGNGWPLAWRFVYSRARRAFNEIVNDPNRGPWNRRQPDGSTHAGHTDAYEQIVTTAEQIAWTHEFSDGIERDHGDVLLELMEFAIQWRKANGLPTSAFEK